MPTDSDRGVEALKAGDYDRAIACFDAALRRRPHDAAAYLGRGLAHARKGSREAAVGDLTQAIRLGPGNAMAYVRRGFTYSDMGEHEKAIRDYTEAVRLAPRDPKTYVLRAGSYQRTRQNARAVQDCTEALRLDPGYAAAHVARGIAYADGRDYERAARDYAEALRLDPRLAVAYSRFAWLLATCPQDGLRDGDRALAYARKALHLRGGQDPHFLESLAAAHAEKGRFREAARWQLQALERQQYGAEEEGEARMRLQLYLEGRPYRELDGPHVEPD
jgi:tetratricopeptide (TPR) repeat protein